MINTDPNKNNYKENNWGTPALRPASNVGGVGQAADWRSNNHRRPAYALRVQLMFPCGHY
jgi:hypothetical protein